MPSPWDDNNVKANLAVISQLQANQRLKTSERGRVLVRFRRFTKTIFNKEPSMEPARFHRPIVEVFKRGTTLATAHSTDSRDTKITKDDLKAAFTGLLVLSDTFQQARNRQRYERVKSVITNVNKAIRKIGDKDTVYQGGWNDKIRIDGRRGTITHRLDPKQMDVMLRPGITALMHNSSLCNEAAAGTGSGQIRNLNDGWIRRVYGSASQLLSAQMPTTGQVYQRQGSGICAQAVMDWNRWNLRHRSGTHVIRSGYYPFGEDFKGVNPDNPGEVKALYNDVGRNQAMLFALSQLTNQAVLISVPTTYLTLNGSEDPDADPVLFYKNIGVKATAWNNAVARIKRGGRGSAKVIVECIGDLDVNQPAIGVIKRENTQEMKIMSLPRYFGIEGIHFVAEVGLEWKKKKSRNLMKVDQKTIHGTFTIRLSGRVHRDIQAYRGADMLNLMT